MLSEKRSQFFPLSVLTPYGGEPSILDRLRGLLIYI